MCLSFLEIGQNISVHNFGDGAQRPERLGRSGFFYAKIVMN